MIILSYLVWWWHAIGPFPIDEWLARRMVLEMTVEVCVLWACVIVGTYRLFQLDTRRRIN